ncbi:MAG TPA: lysophospholipid acyltransferase family protein [Candidatus Udaeobacter sp.]|jgi:1-acyl-sn-glycerol-3-phosphate acyltransferase
MKTSDYDSACDIDQSLVDRLRRFPREPDMLVYGVRALIALIIRGWLRVYHRFEIIGHENLRTNRSLVIVANHSSHLDTLCLLAALPLRKLHRAFPAAAADYFFQSVPRTFIASVVTNALPFARRVRVRRSLSLCSELLSDPGNILIIFPEGTRSKTGETREFKSGIGALVAGRDVAVLPCYLQGAFRAWPKGRHLPRPRKVRLVVGAPRSYSSRKTNKSDICTIAAELHRAVKELAESNGSD